MPLPKDGLLSVARSFDPSGYFYDFDRPKLRNPDGSYSTEETMTEFIDGRWVNFPSIWGGRRVDFDTALELTRAEMGRGKVFPNFSSLEEAKKEAVARSEWRGTLGLLGFD